MTQPCTCLGCSAHLFRLSPDAMAAIAAHLGAGHAVTNGCTASRAMRSGVIDFAEFLRGANASARDEDAYKAPEQRGGGCFGGACPMPGPKPANPCDPAYRAPRTPTDEELARARAARCAPAPQDPIAGFLKEYATTCATLIPMVMGWLETKQEQKRIEQDAHQFRYAQNRAIATNCDLAIQRLELAGEALATAAELGTTGTAIAPYVARYRTAAALVVADVPVHGDEVIEEPSQEPIPVVTPPPSAPAATGASS